MQKAGDVFWAKKAERDGQYYWLPLSQHLEDTRQVCGLLWEHWLCEGVRRFLCKKAFGGVSEELVKKTFQFLGAVHDIGKATPAFQKQEGHPYAPDLDKMLLERLEQDGYTGIATAILSSRKFTPHALAGQVIVARYGVSEDLASIVGAHHGKPVDTLDTCSIQEKSYTANYYQLEKSDEAVYQKWENAQKRLFRWALESSNFASAKELPSVTQPGQVLLSGLLIMADWIASNEYYFPLIPVEGFCHIDRSARIQRGWMTWYQTAPWAATPETDIDAYYERRFDFKKQGFSPRVVQRRFSETIAEAQDPGLFILEAPMGVGKTEAALVGVEQLAYKTGRSGLFFGLPTQATANGIFPRLLAWLTRVDAEFGEAVSVRLVHGKAMLNEYFTELSRHMDVDGEGGLIVNEWFSGRKTKILDDFVVGTVDQFLLMALKQKHLALRHLGFSKKVVVLDEVHAYDAYMSQYLMEAVRWLGAYHVPVILLSATLPAERRRALVKNYLYGTDESREGFQEAKEYLLTSEYPLITYTDGIRVKQVAVSMPSEQKEICVERYGGDIYDKIEELLSAGGIIGVIVNTVKRAQDIATGCVSRFSEPVVELLHSSFEATQRMQKEDSLLQTIGKSGNRPTKKIIIGTQVLEQSLDIDFDVLLTDLAPMDLLIQRIGRLHRHRRVRPSAHEKPVVYILGTDENFDFDSGTKAVYGGYLLAKTQCVLPEVLHFPADISPLVQQVYGRSSIPMKDTQKSLYEALEEEYHSVKKRKEEKAKQFRIGSPVYQAKSYERSSLVSWLKNRQVLESEEMAYAQVRDGEASLEVIALQKIGEGYGFLGGTEDISEMTEDPGCAREMIKHTLRLPSVLCKNWCIDRTIRELEDYQRKILPTWQNSSYLKGLLGIIFDENQEALVNGYRLHYNKKYGLTYHKEQEPDSGKV